MNKLTGLQSEILRRIEDDGWWAGEIILDVVKKISIVPDSGGCDSIWFDVAGTIYGVSCDQGPHGNVIIDYEGYVMCDSWMEENVNLIVALYAAYRVVEGSI